MRTESSELQTAIQAAREGTKVLLSYFNQGHAGEVTKKGRVDRVSQADLDSENVIRKIISDAFPEHNINGEELGESSKESKYVWYIDPLCGSNDFIRGFPEFGMSIALAHDGKPVLGVCSLPVFQEIYWAEKGGGAFMNGEPISVSKTENPEDSIVSTHISAKDHDVKPSIMIAEKLAEHYLKVPGSFPYSVCSLARGKSEIHAEINVSAIHSLASVVIAEEAGGKVSKLDGSAWSITDQEILVTNGLLHNYAVQLLKKE